MKKVVIAISSNVLKDSSGNFAGYERSYINSDYILSIEKNNACAIILPIVDDEESIKTQISLADALILSGGYDVNPKFYNEEASKNLGQICTKRDVYELKLIKYAILKNIPILGICRGLQILNVYFGGTLYQDINSLKNTIKHSQDKEPKEEIHSVKLSSKLLEIFKQDEIMVNSFHHQAIKKLASNFEICALAKDNIIEGIFSKEHDFILAIQWHPEMLHESNINMNKIFQTLIHKARK